jgi:hypothetical protein
VKVAAEGNGNTVEVAATTTKGNAIYETEFTSLIEGLRRVISGTHPDKREGNREKIYA